MDLEKEITKLERYLNRQGRTELVQELRRLSNDARRERLKGQAIHEQETLDLRAKDKKLIAAKAEARDLNAIYNEQLRMNKKISRFIHLLIEDSGKI